MKKVLLLFALAATLVVPFALRPARPSAAAADRTLVIITPHNEAIRRETGRAFQRWYRARTGRTVFVDWRVIGGTSEISRYLEGEYTTAFHNLWTGPLKRAWSAEVEAAFANPAIKPDATPGDDTPAEAARRAFLASDAGCGIDVFYGGGTYDFIKQAQAGRLIDSGLRRRRPEWFSDEAIPRYHAGEEYWDGDGLWFGAVLSNYGILSSRDSLARLGIAAPPARWSDLADPRLRGEVGVADPTKSGAAAKAFENVIQQQMQERLFALQLAAPSISGTDPVALERRAVREGWFMGLQLVQLIGANARYFTDSSQKPPIDVASGNCAAAMCIDFYGRQQAEAVRRRGGSNRLEFLAPAGGTVSSVDPIALLRGARHREVAGQFIEWVLSPEGQKLWNFRPGTPGGPKELALRRLPVRRDFYARDDWKPFRTDPDVSPFAPGDQLIYREEWTGGLFRELAFVIRVMCLDTHTELAAAWREIIAAGLPPQALATLQDVSAIDYDTVAGEIHTALTSRKKVDEMTLAKRLGNRFRAQYQRAAELARARR